MRRSTGKILDSVGVGREGGSLEIGAGPLYRLVRSVPACLPGAPHPFASNLAGGHGAGAHMSLMRRARLTAACWGGCWSPTRPQARRARSQIAQGPPIWLAMAGAEVGLRPKPEGGLATGDRERQCGRVETCKLTSTGGAKPLLAGSSAISNRLSRLGRQHRRGKSKTPGRQHATIV